MKYTVLILAIRAGVMCARALGIRSNDEFAQIAHDTAVFASLARLKIMLSFSLSDKGGLY
jgi:hypothetical protein